MLWVKAFHVVFVMSWMASLLYLPRLFVYHAGSSDQIGRDRFCVMEYKLYWYIGWPAAVLSTVTGGYLIVMQGLYIGMPSWLHIKLVLIALLWAFHIYCGVFVRQFQQERCRRHGLFFRYWNEIPTILMIAIVIMVIVKPGWGI